MGFVFRTIFWLSLALVIVPPNARLGGDAEAVEWREIDLGLELHNAAYALWGATVETASACDVNPQLCDAASSLWETGVETAANLAKEASARLTEKPAKPAKAQTPVVKKIQARVE